MCIGMCIYLCLGLCSQPPTSSVARVCSSFLLLVMIQGGVYYNVEIYILFCAHTVQIVCCESRIQLVNKQFFVLAAMCDKLISGHLVSSSNKYRYIMLIFCILGQCI